MTRRWRAALAVALTMACGALPAAGEPQLDVAKAGHVDSPKVFHEDGKLELYSEFHGSKRLLDRAVNHLSHAEGRDAQGQHFLFTVPEGARELDFLDAGEHWYMAPAVPGKGNIPIWSGFGADAGVPVEDFRDQLFTLDLVDVRGPGRVEAFAWAPDFDGGTGSVQRMFSSVDPRYRSAGLNAGSHTHNYTLFSKPGAYELTFRATARTADGRLLTSTERVQRWQVGGNAPGTGLETEASDHRAEQPTFSVAPTPDQPADVEGQLRTLRADLGRDVTGKAEFTVDGFHLADVEVRGGVAQFTELPGAEAADYQVRVDAGDTSWTSAPLTVEPGGEAARTTEAGEPMPATPAESQQFPAAEQTAAGDVDVTIEFEPGPTEDSRAVRVRTSEPLVGFVEIAAYDGEGDVAPEIVDGAHLAGTQETTWLATVDSWREGLRLVATVQPHPLMRGVSAKRLTLADSYEPGQRGPWTLTLPASAAEPAPEPPATPEPPASEGRVLLDHGHVDLAAVPADDGLGLVLKDDTRIAAKESVDRRLDEVALVVPEAARRARSPRQGPAWDAVLGEGDTWLLPYEQTRGLVWPGYSTDRLDHDADRTPVRLELVGADGPGDVTLFRPDALSGNPDVLLGTRDGAPRAIELEGPTHAHAGWAFTAAGEYRLQLRYVRGDQASPVETLVVLVGDRTEQQTPAPEEPGETSTPAEPDAAPTPEQPGADATREQPSEPASPDHVAPKAPTSPAAPSQAPVPAPTAAPSTAPSVTATATPAVTPMGASSPTPTPDGGATPALASPGLPSTGV